MSRLLCCRRARQPDMGAALSHSQEGEACDGASGPAALPTMADVIRERKKKAGGAGLGTLRRRLAAAARRPKDPRPDRGCEHARLIRSVVGSWRLAEVWLLHEELEAGAALRDLTTQADLAREPAPALHQDLADLYRDRWWCDVELVGAGWSLPAHRAILSARSTYFRDLLHRYPSGCGRVPLEGAGAALSRGELTTAVRALYGAVPSGTLASHSRRICDKWGRDTNSENDLDVNNVDNGNYCTCSSRCTCTGAGALRRLADLLGFSPDGLHTDMRYLLDSGEYADARLSFRAEGGCGAQYGFRSAVELPCHRLVLAARSRFFRKVMSRRAGVGAGGAVCVDEKVVPRRFARALLHAAYTDQVELNLIGRGSSPPSSANSTTSSSSGWPGVARGTGGARGATPAALEDAFQLYEIARFLEMPIVVQGCEDAIVEALSAETLPLVLRWAAAPHASHWVHRQAMRYLRDEFPSIMSHAASAKLPHSALAEALNSPFLQASETQALRSLLRWAERAALTNHHNDQREPNVVWHTAHSVSRRGGRRREVSDACVREALAPLVSLVRLEHLPPDSEILNQVVRRGVVPAPAAEGSCSADAWLGRGAARHPRCFLPYLDEIKALLEDQEVPEAEIARVRRTRYLHKIPDTLYMVAAERGAHSGVSTGGAGADGGAERACVSARTVNSLRARFRELRAAPPAARALALRATDSTAVYRQIALRAVRERSLPDACADLLLADVDADTSDRERSSGEWESPQTERRGLPNDDCCRGTSGSASARCSSAGSLRSAALSADNSRSSTCRREATPRSDLSYRLSVSEVGSVRGRLSAAVPDVAMAPNANTHLLTTRDYFRHAPPWEFSGGGVLQLDLGDGATHTPRPGSRATRAAHAGRQRDQPQVCVPAARVRPDEDELRAAIELSVIRAYSTFHVAASSPQTSARLRQPYELPPQPAHTAGGARSSPSPSLGAAQLSVPRPDLHHTLHHSLSRGSGASGEGGSRALRTPSPRRRDYSLYRPRHHRAEGGYSPGPSSRGPSPSGYA